MEVIVKIISRVMSESEGGSGRLLFLPRIILQMLKISLKIVLLPARVSQKKDLSAWFHMFETNHHW